MALRALYTVAVVAIVVWLLAAGAPLGALVVAAAAVALRRAVESGRLPRRAERPLTPS